MKKDTHYFLLAFLSFAMCAASCTDSPDKISERQILKKYNNQLKENVVNEAFEDIKVGYYESSSQSERCLLKQLAAADMITFDVERFAWWECIEGTREETYYTKEIRGYYYLYYEDVKHTRKKDFKEYNFCDHIFVKVELTPKGQKFVVDNLPEPKDKADEDLNQPEIDATQFPESSVECEEKWEYIPNPFVDVVEDYALTEEIEEEQEEQTTEEIVDDSDTKITRIEESQYLAYQEAVKKENSEQVHVKCYEIDATKARNIQILRDINGATIASAEIITTTENVTPFGRILNGAIEGYKHLVGNVKLNYYIDKGWVLEDANILNISNYEH